MNRVTKLPQMVSGRTHQCQGRAKVLNEGGSIPISPCNGLPGGVPAPRGHRPGMLPTSYSAQTSPPPQTREHLLTQNINSAEAEKP